MWDFILASVEKSMFEEEHYLFKTWKIYKEIGIKTFYA